jgi:hypothetical protein
MPSRYDDDTTDPDVLLARDLERRERDDLRAQALLDAEVAAQLLEAEREREISAEIAALRAVAGDRLVAERLAREEAEAHAEALARRATDTEASAEAARRLAAEAESDARALDADHAAAERLSAELAAERAAEDALRLKELEVSAEAARRIQAELDRENEEAEARAARELAERLAAEDDEEERRCERESEEAVARILGDDARARGAPAVSTSLVSDISQVSTCAICTEERAGREMFLVEDCFHAFCFECMRRHILSRMESAHATDIPCPEPSCKRQLAPHEIRHCLVSCLDLASFERFDNLALQDSLSRIEGVRWCPRCNTALIGNPDAASPQITCPADNCGFSFCYNCKDPWHPEITCAAYQAHRDSNEDPAAVELRNWLAANTKTCPKCSIAIEKNEGCNHIVCSSCKHSWCWVCAKNWNVTHHLCKMLNAK